MPQKVVYYEHFSSRAHAGNSVVGALKFLDSLTPAVDYAKFYESEERIQGMKKIIEEPKYEHGTLIARVCGKEMAREIHALTRSVTMRLGYVFENDTATWKLSSDVKFI